MNSEQIGPPLSKSEAGYASQSFLRYLWRANPSWSAVLNLSNSGVPGIVDRERGAGIAYGNRVSRYLGEDLPHRFLKAEKKGLSGRFFGA